MNNRKRTGVYKYIIIPTLVIIIVLQYIFFEDRIKQNVELYDISEYCGLVPMIEKFIDDGDSLRQERSEYIGLLYSYSDSKRMDTIKIIYLNDDDLYTLSNNDNIYIAFCKRIRNKKVLFIPKNEFERKSIIAADLRNRNRYFRDLFSIRYYKTLLFGKNTGLFYVQNRRRCIIVYYCWCVNFLIK